MRIPVTIQCTEPGCRQRFVYRRVVRDPRKATRNGRCVRGEPFRKARIEQACVTWTTPVMQEAEDRFDTQLLQPRQTLVQPSPVKTIRRLRRRDLPYRRI